MIAECSPLVQGVKGQPLLRTNQRGRKIQIGLQGLLAAMSEGGGDEGEGGGGQSEQQHCLAIAVCRAKGERRELEKLQRAFSG